MCQVMVAKRVHIDCKGGRNVSLCMFPAVVGRFCQSSCVWIAVRFCQEGWVGENIR